MSLLDCLLMTLFSAGICLALPKVISLMQEQKANLLPVNAIEKR